MSNSVTVITSDEHVDRVKRIGAAAVWIEFTVLTSLADAPEDRPIVVVGEHPASDPRIAYVVRAAIPDDQLQAVVTAIATGSPVAGPPNTISPQSPAEAKLVQRAFAASRKLAAASDLLTTELTTIGALIEVLDLSRAYMLFFDGASGALWAQSKQLADDDDRAAVGGMVGWSARTGLACAATVAGDDPRFDALIDDPDGEGADQIMVQPILGSDARVHGVLVAVRRARTAPFGPDDALVFARFAGFAAPLLDQLSTHVEGMELINAEADQDPRPRFRKEAVEASDVRQWGDIIRVSPRWLSWGYWMLLVLLAGSVAMLVLGRVSTYSSGPAVVRSMARTTIVARTSGNVSTLAVAPGDHVRAGTPIARLDDVDQRAAVDRIERDFDAQLRNHMVDPADQAADSSLRSLRQALDQARTALEERTIVAPADGVVSDLRVRPGQHLEPGDIAASIVDGDAGLEVVALLPGEDRPQLAPGMTIRLELTGYRYAYQSIVIESTSSDVIAPAEARRVLGAEVAEGMRLGGPVVIVRGRIPSLSFDADGRTFTYHDGMLGIAEVQIREERIVFALVPGMRRFGE